jgi:MoaA/NifB/PqqE/SkfB family radical SAM enzyme
MYADNHIRSIHLELTSKCNAACPMCARNVRGGADNPLLPLTELTLDDIRHMFPDPLTGILSELDHIIICGTYGDPIIARDLLPILSYLRSIRPTMTFSINTNGSARTVKWWHELGGLLQTRRNVVAFGIDGLADTNHLYRRHTTFGKIIENVQAYIAAGGVADWVFMPFRHNEHQVDAARDMATRMGFRRFTMRYTTRFDRSQRFRVDADPPYELLPATNSPTSNRAEQIIAKYGSVDTYLDTTPITCQTSAEGSLYVSAEGLVFPCCWMGTIYNDMGPFDSQRIRRVIDESGGMDMINAKRHPIGEIVTGSFFQDVMRRWSVPMAEGRLKVCAHFCGKC